MRCLKKQKFSQLKSQSRGKQLIGSNQGSLITFSLLCILGSPKAFLALSVSSVLTITSHYLEPYKTVHVRDNGWFASWRSLSTSYPLFSYTDTSEVYRANTWWSRNHIFLLLFFVLCTKTVMSCWFCHVVLQWLLTLYRLLANRMVFGLTRRCRVCRGQSVIWQLLWFHFKETIYSFYLLQHWGKI